MTEQSIHQIIQDIDFNAALLEDALHGDDGKTITQMRVELQKLKKQLGNLPPTLYPIWVKADQQEPSISGYYYCKIYDEYSQERKVIVEWAEKKNGDHKYYDWCLSDVDSWYGVREETKVVEWLDE